ncbi:hypothetical protein O3M35_008600 [Rhynocoris fuscipes]|uniref:Uncharacterized protein n=1 Tax=Rhynocoris fuscipes TaxID=488301 RepID=A0AAW1DE87_9HEMI
MDQSLSQTHRQTEIFLLHFWNQEPSKRIFPLRKVYVRKHFFLTENNTFLLLHRLESKKFMLKCYYHFWILLAEIKKLNGKKFIT